MPAQNRRCGFNMRTFLTAVLLAAVSVILMAVFNLHSQGKIDATSIISFMGILTILVLLACFNVVAGIISIAVNLKLLRWITVFIDKIIKFFMTAYWRGQIPVQHESPLRRTDSTRGMESIALDSSILDRGRNRSQRSASEDIGRSKAYDELTVHPFPDPRKFQKSSTLMERVICSEYSYLLMWLYGILDLALPPGVKKLKLPRSLSDSIIQPNVRRHLPVLLKNQNSNRMQNEVFTNKSIYSPQPVTAAPSGKQKVKVVRFQEDHLPQGESFVHRRHLLRTECASATKEQIDTQQRVLSGPSRTQRETESNVDYRTDLVSVESRNESPEIVSKRLHGSHVQRSESLPIPKQSREHVPRQISDALTNIGRRLRQRRSSLDESFQGEQSNKISEESLDKMLGIFYK